MNKNEFTTVVLTNGICVANFSSPHDFTFTDGSVLGGCSAERAKELMLESREVETPGIKGSIDIDLTFDLSMPVRAELVRLAGMKEVDIILVPFPVMTAWKEYCATSNDPDYLPSWVMEVFRKVRCCRVADRVTKVIYADKFCK